MVYERGGEEMNYQVNTKNQSFLDVWEQLTSLGVKNNKFMFKLINPDLIFIDPWDPDLTENQKRLVLEECINNFWYFIREVLRWPREDRTISPTKLDRGNTAMYWNSLEGVSTWRSNIRQSCSDLSVNSFLLWRLLSTLQVSLGIVSFHRNEVSAQIAKIKQLIHCLPKSISPLLNGLLLSNDTIRNNQTNSIIKRLGSPRSMTQAKNIGCGDMSEICFYHSPEFMIGLEEVIDSRRPILQGDIKRFNIFNSPFNKIDNDKTLVAMEYIEGMIKWQDRFYDYDIEEYYSVINRYSNGVVYIRHDYNQLGYTEEWFKIISSAMRHDPKAVKRELLLQRA